MSPESPMERARALLLVGPTGSGKSPVGMLLEGLGPFCHFDFGAELRAAAEGRRGLQPEDVAFVRHLLDDQLLLPDESFDIALGLLGDFLARRRFDPRRQWLVLNGLPRHVGQARDIAPLVAISHVFVLECDQATILERVRRRVRGDGLDHSARPDDTPGAVARKLAIYEAETLPLVAHYRSLRGVAVHHLRVEAATPEDELARRIAALVLGPGAEERWRPV